MIIDVDIEEGRLNQRVLFLKRVTLFTETDEKILKYIALHLSNILVLKGENVFSKNDPGHSMFIIVSGSVKVHDGHHIFTTLTEGQFFGEYSLLDAQVRSASVTALERSELLRLGQEEFFHVMSENIEVSRSVLKSIVKRLYDKDHLEEQLAQRNLEILQQKEEITAQRDEIEAQRNEIEIQRDEVIRQRDQIIFQQREITASIRYARRIQNAVLPPVDSVYKLLPQHFILFKPRDIVSGDFYWIGRKNNSILVAAADCTGHGVPGAFMSMLGIAFLNEIASRSDIHTPGQMLDYLREQVIFALNQTGRFGEATDGMDIAICMIDFQLNELQYAGANNPLWLIRKQVSEEDVYQKIKKNEHHTDVSLIELKPDRMPIGISNRLDYKFKNHVIPLQSGDSIYLFSDGFSDQFGGHEGRKYYSKNFKELLISIQDCPMDIQHGIIEQTLKEWTAFPNPDDDDNQFEQIDDILVIGIRI